MKIEIARFTSKGVRKNNQDALLIEKYDDRNTGLASVIAIADGMGGMASGEVASRIAVERLSKLVKEDLSKPNPLIKEDINKFLQDSYSNINDAILLDAMVHPERDGMGTTLVSAFIFEDDTFITANVGDSRAYILDDEAIQITEDHDVLTDSAKKGIKNSNSAANAAIYGNALTRFLGDTGYTNVDILNAKRLKEENSLLLCSDGFYRFIEEEQLLYYLREKQSLQKRTDALAHLALNSGSNDNISLILVEKNKSANLKVAKKKKSKYKLALTLILFLLILLASAYFLFYEYLKEPVNHNFNNNTNIIFNEKDEIT